MIDDRLANELERIGVEGRAIILAMFAPSSRVASPQGPEIIGIARPTGLQLIATLDQVAADMYGGFESVATIGS